MRGHRTGGFGTKKVLRHANLSHKARVGAGKRIPGGSLRAGPTGPTRTLKPGSIKFFHENVTGQGR